MSTVLQPFTQSPTSKRPAQTNALTFYQENDSGRSEVESFIHEVFARCYGAQVARFAPVLAGLRGLNGMAAVAGYRTAKAAPLFLERYLSAPIETLIPFNDGRFVARESIVEVGHLASMTVGAGRRMIALLVSHLIEQKFQWVVCTSTEELQRLFLRLGITPLTLGVADPIALSEEAVNWGSYFKHKPLVMAGYLPQVASQIGCDKGETS